MPWNICGRTYSSTDEMTARVAALDRQYQGLKFDDDARAEWNTLNSTLDEVGARNRVVAELVRTGRGLEYGSGVGSGGTRDFGAWNDGVSAALREIERMRNDETISTDAADHIDAYVRRDRLGVDGRYIAAVASPSYASAFAKVLADPVMGHNRMSAEELAAVQAVNAAEAERGLVAGTGSAGGFALPIAIDPTVMLSSAGVIADGVRRYARVESITTHELRLVSSAGTAASYDAEASEVSDDTPTLAQPVVTPAMARYFIPFSYEVGDDWTSIQTELLRLTSDARDTLDATKFLTGSGTDEPAGVLSGLTTAQRAQTAGTAAYAVGDPWLLKAAIRPRDVATTVFAAAPAIWDQTYRFVGGNSTEPAQFDTGRGGNFLGQPKFEWSTMVSTNTTASKIMIGGDWHAGYLIADRIGMSAEIIPALFGAGQRPTGQRGFFARWRTGAKTVVPEALRYLEVR
ncbi:MAG: hypothetical protein V7607_3228 [Solirubrobacteraceae bacterium]